MIAVFSHIFVQVLCRADAYVARSITIIMGQLLKEGKADSRFGAFQTACHQLWTYFLHNGLVFKVCACISVVACICLMFANCHLLSFQGNREEEETSSIVLPTASPFIIFRGLLHMVGCP